MAWITGTFLGKIIYVHVKKKKKISRGPGAAHSCNPSYSGV
jgi:hypothetical protein